MGSLNGSSPARRLALLALPLITLLAVLAAPRPALPALAQSGGYIAFSDGGAGGRDLWGVLPDGSGRRSLVSIGAGREAQPTWSPDGRFVAYATELPDGQWAIGRADASGSGIRLLTNGPG